MQYLVTGANGQLGTELSKMMDDRGLNYWGYDAKNMDITKRDLVFDKIRDLKPDVIFHCAA